LIVERFLVGRVTADATDATDANHARAHKSRKASFERRWAVGAVCAGPRVVWLNNPFVTANDLNVFSDREFCNRARTIPYDADYLI
jgi:hypothetical protein